jgi:hypothetical protein
MAGVGNSLFVNYVVLILFCNLRFSPTYISMKGVFCWNVKMTTHIEVKIVWLLGAPPRQRPHMKDFGSGERGASDELKGKASANQGKYDYIIKIKLGLHARSQCVPPPAPPGPLYRWPGPIVLVGYDTNYICGLQFLYSNLPSIGSFLGS